MPPSSKLLIFLLLRECVTRFVQQWKGKNLVTQSAVIHQLLIIGDGVKKFSPESRAAYPQVSWNLIAGTLDKLMHLLR